MNLLSNHFIGGGAALTVCGKLCLSTVPKSLILGTVGIGSMVLGCALLVIGVLAKLHSLWKDEQSLNNENERTEHTKNCALLFCLEMEAHKFCDTQTERCIQIANALSSSLSLSEHHCGSRIPKILKNLFINARRLELVNYENRNSSSSYARDQSTAQRHFVGITIELINSLKKQKNFPQNHLKTWANGMKARAPEWVNFAPIQEALGVADDQLACVGDQELNSDDFWLPASK